MTGAGPLTRRGLFELAADEALRDGQIDPDENRLLIELAGCLKLTADEVRYIVSEAAQRFRSGAFLDDARPLDPLKLYDRIVIAVNADGVVSPTEQLILDGMRRLLKLDDVPAAADPATPPPPAPAAATGTLAARSDALSASELISRAATVAAGTESHEVARGLVSGFTEELERAQRDDTAKQLILALIDLQQRLPEDPVLAKILVEAIPLVIAAAFVSLCPARCTAFVDALDMMLLKHGTDEALVTEMAGSLERSASTLPLSQRGDFRVENVFEDIEQVLESACTAWPKSRPINLARHRFGAVRHPPAPPAPPVATPPTTRSGRTPAVKGHVTREVSTAANLASDPGWWYTVYGSIRWIIPSVIALLVFWSTGGLGLVHVTVAALVCVLATGHSVATYYLPYLERRGQSPITARLGLPSRLPDPGGVLETSVEIISDENRVIRSAMLRVTVRGEFRSGWKETTSENGVTTTRSSYRSWWDTLVVPPVRLTLPAPAGSRAAATAKIAMPTIGASSQKESEWLAGGVYEFEIAADLGDGKTSTVRCVERVSRTD